MRHPSIRKTWHLAQNFLRSLVGTQQYAVLSGSHSLKAEAAIISMCHCWQLLPWNVDRLFLTLGTMSTCFRPANSYMRSICNMTGLSLLILRNMGEITHILRVSESEIMPATPSEWRIAKGNRWDPWQRIMGDYGPAEYVRSATDSSVQGYEKKNMRQRWQKNKSERK
jgi:hypothetical protein